MLTFRGEEKRSEMETFRSRHDNQHTVFDPAGSKNDGQDRSRFAQGAHNFSRHHPRDRQPDIGLRSNNMLDWSSTTSPDGRQFVEIRFHKPQQHVLVELALNRRRVRKKGCCLRWRWTRQVPDLETPRLVFRHVDMEFISAQTARQISSGETDSFPHRSYFVYGKLEGRHEVKFKVMPVSARSDLLIQSSTSGGNRCSLRLTAIFKIMRATEYTYTVGMLTTGKYWGHAADGSQLEFSTEKKNSRSLILIGFSERSGERQRPDCQHLCVHGRRKWGRKNGKACLSNFPHR